MKKMIIAATVAAALFTSSFANAQTDAKHPVKAKKEHVKQKKAVNVNGDKGQKVDGKKVQAEKKEGKPEKAK